MRPRRRKGFHEVRICWNVVVCVARRAKNQCRSNDGGERNQDDHNDSNHRQTIAYEAPHGLMKQRVSRDDFRRTQYRILGSITAYAMSTSRLQTRIVIEINATI